MKRHLYSAVLWIVALACGASGCGAAPAAPKPHMHTEGHGPLSASSGNGVMAMPPPSPGIHWTSTFGAFVLCRAKGSGSIELDKVQVSGPLPADRVRYFLRNVPQNDGTIVPLMAVRGSPPTFAEPYARPHDGGKYEGEIQGHKVTKACGPLDTRDGFTELLVVVTAGPKGAYLDHVQIDYSYAGRKYGLELKAKLVLCGTGAAVQEFCA